MTISHKWLHDYLPVTIDPETLSKILTSIGLEVESLEKYESHKGGLEGLVIGQVLEAGKHPNADKLKVTKVDIGEGDPLQIVCGAANVVAGQKVVVATVGSTIYPMDKQPLTMKMATIRGVESMGMICAEDEIGISDDHSGIMVLPSDVPVGITAADYFKPYSDWIYEIGLTPNRMDAMSHLGVARDVCAYLSHHNHQNHQVKSPFKDALSCQDATRPVKVIVENTDACKRYSGISITGVSVGDSPEWLQQRLRSIGQRPINNIVDITNFLLHETGQPLHAFDLDHVKEDTIRVMNLPEGTIFTTLDEKDRKLSSDDLMICNGAGEGMCIAGVFGGMNSGVKESTQNIFLESAWFNPVEVRKTSFRHNLRTDAATRFEKNVDISNTVNVLVRAASMIVDVVGGKISSSVVDVYPAQQPKKEVVLRYDFLRKLSGKKYQAATARNILKDLSFDVVEETADFLKVTVPYSKPDVSLPADVVEEVMRIDGYDNIQIPSSITISPAVETDGYKHAYKEKVSNNLVGAGFSEIFTNSITNAAYFEEGDLANGVRLLNNLSAVHNIMRPSMLETGLEAVAYNLNRKNTDLKFFEFGKTYHTVHEAAYVEKNHLSLYVSGRVTRDSWKTKGEPADLYYLKGIVKRILGLVGTGDVSWKSTADPKLDQSLEVEWRGQTIAVAGLVKKRELTRFDIKQPVFFADFDWNTLETMMTDQSIRLTELPRQLPVHRDLAMIVPRTLTYGSVESAVKSLNLPKLREVRLFDIFESEKLGSGKKSLAISITFLDEEKTLTDTEIDSMMQKLMSTLEKDLHAEIRRQTS